MTSSPRGCYYSQEDGPLQPEMWTRGWRHHPEGVTIPRRTDRYSPRCEPEGDVTTRRVLLFPGGRTTTARDVNQRVTSSPGGCYYSQEDGPLQPEIWTRGSRHHPEGVTIPRRTVRYSPRCEPEGDVIIQRVLLFPGGRSATARGVNQRMTSSPRGWRHHPEGVTIPRKTVSYSPRCEPGDDVITQRVTSSPRGCNYSQEDSLLQPEMWTRGWRHHPEGVTIPRRMVSYSSRCEPEGGVITQRLTTSPKGCCYTQEDGQLQPDMWTRVWRHYPEGDVITQRV